MSQRLFVSTRKGLFSYLRQPSGWTPQGVSFVGDAVSLSLHDHRGGYQGTLYAGLGLGHFGVKLRRSTDFGASWEEVAAPAFPATPDGHVETTPDGKSWPCRVDGIWALEAGMAEGELWSGTIGGGLFRSTDRTASWQFVRALWDHPKRKEWLGGGGGFARDPLAMPPPAGAS